MRDFEGKVAVITGAASGIGLALAEACAERGMQVAMADVEPQALETAAQTLRDRGAAVRAEVVDVSRLADVERLRERTMTAWGGVHLLCNNAGVGAGTTVWESSQRDWEWVMGVNLWGVIHGCRVFLPAMLEQEAGGHVVNTASVAGVLPYHFCSAYQVTKHAVVALSEQLFYSLGRQQARVGASVLCPGWVRTRIMASARNRPADLSDGAPLPPDAAAEEEFWTNLSEQNTIIQPADVARRVLEAVERQEFWIFTHGDEFDEPLRRRMESMLAGRNPELGLAESVSRPGGTRQPGA